MKIKGQSGGYMWLLFLLVGVVLIVVFTIQGGLLPGSETDGNFFDKAKGVIDETKATKQKLEDGYRFDPEEQERSIDDMN
jgi:hypothetical protein